MPEEKLRQDYAAIEKDYQRDVRIVSWRPKFVAAGYLAWALVDVALLVFFLVNVVLYVVSGSFEEAREIATMAQNVGVAREVSVARAAEPIILEDVHVLTRAQGSYDLYAIAENPNAEWYATFDYYFVAGDVTTDVTQGSLMPGESRYLLGLGVEAESRPAGASIVVDNVVWERVDRHEVTDTAEFLVDHEYFTVSGGTYAVDVELASDSVGRSTFTITNNTAYSYISPTFVVLLTRSGVVTAVNQVVLSGFETGETRDVTVHWFGAVPTNGTVEVIPAINYFDEDAYMAPPGEVQSDIRDNEEFQDF
ncbi:hypothetical protein HYS28_02970 [Candidatus Uhrbacteria bacterium]|nr:hypothetical protein [Candidatus Uhrbacteria bacterium]